MQIIWLSFFIWGEQRPIIRNIICSLLPLDILQELHWTNGVFKPCSDDRVPYVWEYLFVSRHSTDNKRPAFFCFKILWLFMISNTYFWSDAIVQISDNILLYIETIWKLTDVAVIFKSIICKFLIQNSSLGIRCEIALRWMPQNGTNEKSTLVQVMAWCHHKNITWANVDPDLCRHIVSLVTIS